jgi:hypothetical protein
MGRLAFEERFVTLKKLLILSAMAVLAFRAAALGQAEDPDERLTKTFHTESMRTLEVRGEIDFELVPSNGKDVEITVETTRALFDQLNISNWWGGGTVAIESGLIGPRERGGVKVKIAVPSLEQLTVIDHSHGTATWPGTKGKIVLTEFSTLELTFTGQELGVDETWLSALTLKGAADTLRASVRYTSSLDTAAFEVKTRELEVDKTSKTSSPATGS